MFFSVEIIKAISKKKKEMVSTIIYFVSNKTKEEKNKIYQTYLGLKFTYTTIFSKVS